MNTQSPFRPLQLPVPTLEQSAHGFPAAPSQHASNPNPTIFSHPSFISMPPPPSTAGPGPAPTSAPAASGFGGALPYLPPHGFFPPAQASSAPPNGIASAGGPNNPAAARSAQHFLHPAPNMAAAATTNASLAYLNDQLARFAATGGLPMASRPMLSASATPNGPSAPGSGASSPGAPRTYRTGYSTPGIGLGGPGFDPATAFSQIAAAGLPSAHHPQHPSTTHHAHPPAHGHGPRSSPFYVNGKRLIWSDMICATIAESPQHRLVIQDLFQGMCQKFPEIHEWANGKDWEARVKNRIKSTLSIKSNLFIKVPRPASAAGKGSWWTLSEEAQELYRSGRLSTSNKQQGVLQSATHHVGHVHHHGAHAHHSNRSTSAVSQRKEVGRAHPPGGHSVSDSRSNGSSRTSSRNPSRTGSPTLRRSPCALGPMGMTALRPPEPRAPPMHVPIGSGFALPQANSGQPFPPGLLPELAGLNAMAMARFHADGLTSPFPPQSGTMTPNPPQLGLNDLTLSQSGPGPQAQPQPQQAQPSAREVAQWRALFDTATPFPTSLSPADSSPKQPTAPIPGDSPASSGPSQASHLTSGRTSLPGSSASSMPPSNDASAPTSAPTSVTASTPVAAPPSGENLTRNVNHENADALLRSLGVDDSLLGTDKAPDLASLARTWPMVDNNANAPRPAQEQPANPALKAECSPPTTTGMPPAIPAGKTDPEANPTNSGSLDSTTDDPTNATLAPQASPTAPAQSPSVPSNPSQQSHSPEALSAPTGAQPTAFEMDWGVFPASTSAPPTASAPASVPPTTSMPVASPPASTPASAL